MIAIDALTTPAIVQTTDEVAIEIYSNKTFMAAGNRLVLRGDIAVGNYCFRETCVIVDGVLQIPIVWVEPTEDGTSDQTARYSAYFRVTGRQPILFLPDFGVPPLASSQSSTTWGNLFLHKAGVLTIPDTNTYTKRQVEELIAMTAGGFLFAGAVTYGLTRLETAPADSGDPVAVGSNSPRLFRAVGAATLVDGVATVTMPTINSASRILLSGQDDDVSGVVRVSSISTGIGFTVSSSNLADKGLVCYAVFDFSESAFAVTERVSGTATLASGVATVLTDQILNDSKVFVSGQDENVSGSLRVGNRLEGVSFDITSSDLADNGLVAWEIVP